MRTSASRRALSGTLAMLAMAAGATHTSAARGDDIDAAPWRERPERPNFVFALDPTFSQETGIRSVTSFVRVVHRYEDFAWPHADSRPFTTYVTAAERLVLLGAIDLPLTQFGGEVIHEAYGHGARGRELGLGPIYSFTVPEPYRKILSPKDTAPDDADTRFSTQPTGADEKILTSLAGIEANLATSWWINASLVEHRGWSDHSDLALYFSKLVYVNTFTAPSLRRPGPISQTSDDVRTYVSDLSDRFNQLRPDQRATIGKKLEAAWLWNLVDPTLVWSVYSQLVLTLIEGRRETRMPLPEIGSTVFYAEPRFGLSPFGAQNGLDVFVRNKTALFDVYGLAGTSGLANYWGGGAKMFHLQVAEWLTASGELDVWRQPEVDFTARSLFNRDETTGANVAASGTFWITDDIGVLVKIAEKTRGYLSSQPLAGGPYGYLGVEIKDWHGGRAR